MYQTLTVKLRLRDKHTQELCRQARAVNVVWNYCNEISRKAWDRDHTWLTGYDLCDLTAGSSKELNIHAQTIQRVCIEFSIKRNTAKHMGLRWRSKKSLGWIPFSTDQIEFNGSTFKHRKIKYKSMHLNPNLRPYMIIGAGSFNQDARGRWYINCPFDIKCEDQKEQNSIGIDLGLKNLAAISDGSVIEAPKFYRKSEQALAMSQRAGKSKRTRTIHAKIANRRKDFIHKESTKLAKQYSTIFVGNVSSSKLVKTRFAKSTLDVGWADFKTKLSYKALMHGGRMIEVNEANTSRTCSHCLLIPDSSPKGMDALRIREWTCDECKSVHDRDVNAARNILRVGMDTLVAGAA